MSSSNHTAIGPALGYGFQFDRATYRLFEATNNVISVAVESVDDVSVHRADGSSVREQDKLTTTARRPLTDHSVALWKTLAIWANAVINDPSVLSNTEFHLVTNGEVESTSVAARIGAFHDESDATSLVDELKTMANGLRSELEEFGATIRNISVPLLAELLQKVFVFDNVSPSFGGRLEDLQSLRLLGPVQREAIFNSATGWVKRQILTKAQNGEPTLVDRAAFDREARALLRRTMVAPLAMTLELQDSIPSNPAEYESYGFVQQLDWIDSDPGFVRECVIHHAQAKAMRISWSDADLVSEASLRAYEDDLKITWQLQVRRQRNRTYPSPVVQGQERLNETLLQDAVLDGQQMPKVITCGSFHALADFDAETDPEIGWHPDFEGLRKANS